MPSSKKARLAMITLSDDTGVGPIYELGSGWGNLIIPLAIRYPQRQIVGYELSLLPWLISVLVKKVLGVNNVQLHRKNYLQADLSEAAVIICYLFPRGMQDLENKLKTGHDKLEYLISNNFALPSHRAVKKIQLDDLYQSPVYLYQFK